MPSDRHQLLPRHVVERDHVFEELEEFDEPIPLYDSVVGLELPAKKLFPNASNTDSSSIDEIFHSLNPQP